MSKGNNRARHTANLKRVKDLIDVAEELNIIKSKPYALYSSFFSHIHMGLSERELLSLFSIHTMIQMYVNSLVALSLNKAGDPVRTCSGDVIKGYGVSIPQLLWWKDHVAGNSGKKILRVCLEVISHASSLDREDLLEGDPISMLYEELVSRVLRYSSGEYYTPRWVVELVFERLEAIDARLAHESILDPSCGSGRFLVQALREKIALRIEPSKAYYEVLGLDINPLAVAMARARLLITYKLLTDRDPPGTPAILWGDFISFSLTDRYPEIPRDLYRSFLDIVVKSAMKIVGNKGIKNNPVKNISSIHNAIINLLNNLQHKDPEGGSITCNTEDLVAAKICDETHKSLSKELQNELIHTIKKHGESLGILILSSAILGGVLKALNIPKPGIAVTNPPWLEINELPRNAWGKSVRKYVKSEYIGKYGLPRQAVQKGDLSAVFLDLMLGFVRGRGYVGIVLPAGQSYSGSITPHGAGKLLTYMVLEKWGCEGEILYLGDVFRHGIHASIAIVRRGGAYE
ncbi:MAG: N-6 DNA methylase [Sulfolobales archaeon]|jgi:hypothetical protein